MGRKILLSFYLLFAILGLVLPRPWAADKLRFATTVKTHPILVMPVLAAEEKGFWKQNGLEAEWVPFEGDAAAIRGLSARAIDSGLGGTSGTVLAASRGVPIFIAADMQVVDYGFRIWVRGDSPIKEAIGLKGARIGVNLFGGLAHNYGVMAVKALGLDKEVKFLAMGGVPPTIAGLRAGHIEALVLTIFAMANLKARGEVREVLSMVDFTPRKWSEIVIFAHRDVGKDRPEVLKRAVRAIVQSTDFILKNRPWGLEKLKSFFGFEGDLNWIYDRINFGKDGKIDREALENVRNFLIQYGIIAKDKAPPVAELYSRDFQS